MASFLNRIAKHFEGALFAVGLELRAALDDRPAHSVQVAAVRGAPTNHPTGVGLAINVDATGPDDLLYGFAGGAWTAGALNAAAQLDALYNDASATEGAYLIGYDNTLSGLAAENAKAALDELADEAKHQGSVAVARLLMPNQPADGDTIGIGADTYSFTDAAVNTIVNDDTHIAVVIGATAADTRANLIAAINGAGTAGATITLADEETAALEDGTEDLLADQVGTAVRIRSASAPGGTVLAADPSIVLAESITDAADVWDVGAVNMNTLAGAAKALRLEATAVLTVTAAMITSGVRVDFPFTATGFLMQVRSATGGLRTGVIGDLAIINTGGILLTFAGSAAPAIQANDVVTLHAWS